MTDAKVDPVLATHAKRALDGAAPAHDFLHVLRVVKNCEQLLKTERADANVTLTAALLHELFNYPKNHPDSARSGDVCAERAEALLLSEKRDALFARKVADAIRSHAFSKGQAAGSIEAAILQDADRLDALGAIGIARCMATTSEMGRPFYNPEDPFCKNREPNDKLWGIDHFYKKLIKLPERMNTPSGLALAETRVKVLEQYLRDLATEL
jgi:uncharacterized protein